MFTHTRRSVSFPHRETLISGMQTFRPSVSTLEFDTIHIGAMLCANEVEMKSEVPYRANEQLVSFGRCIQIIIAK